MVFAGWCFSLMVSDQTPGLLGVQAWLAESLAVQEVRLGTSLGL